jgi:hypothetical protein
MKSRYDLRNAIEVYVGDNKYFAFLKDEIVVQQVRHRYGSTIERRVTSKYIETRALLKASDIQAGRDEAAAVKRVKVSEATNTQLDWMVAKALGRIDAGTVKLYLDWSGRATHSRISLRIHPLPDVYYESLYEPTFDWAQGGPIIDKMFTQGLRLHNNEYGVNMHLRSMIVASLPGDIHDGFYFGPTPLIAAMRCYVASKLGDEVEVPEELK